MKAPVLTLVAAMNERRVIGREGDMPWHLPADLKHFKQRTQGKPVVMGRRTFESIGRALPKRRNLVLSRNAFEHEGVEHVRTLEAAIEACAGEPEVMIIGGGEIYRQALPMATRISLTRIENALDGDTFFPEFEHDGWRCVSRERHPADERHAWDMVFEEWER